MKSDQAVSAAREKKIKPQSNASSKAPNGVNSLSLGFVEALYADFLGDPSSVSADWRHYFEAILENTSEEDGFISSPRIGPSFRPTSVFHPPAAMLRNGKNGKSAIETAALQDRLDQLVHAYRVKGHLVAQLDPLQLPRPHPPELDPEFYDITHADMGRRLSTNTIYGPDVLTLRQIIDRLQNTYCRSIGVEFMHIHDQAVKKWLQEHMERTQNRTQLSNDSQLRILTKLTDAVMFEEFIQKKFIGAKSFSLEGGESLIPLLDLAIEKAGEQGMDEIVLAMAHRGRLNVLANIMGKSPRNIFREFEDADPELLVGRGDVKYHLGHSSDWKTASGRTVHLSLCFNPSHLEFVNPVAIGRMRAKQDRVRDFERERGMGLLIHGDAAFVGEGVVQETFNLSQLGPYSTGGTLHVIVNNQLGFTTIPSDARSSIYATAPAKMLQIPIFHVNGEDPEAVAMAVHLAMEFRKTFKRDVVIDMYCYRRRGHNEGDEPTYTQPLLYQAIEQRKSVREGYLEHLQKLGDVTPEEADEIAVRRRQHLEDELSAARNDEKTCESGIPAGVWAGYRGGGDRHIKDIPTGVKKEVLSELLEAQTRLPEDFHPHPKIEKFLEIRSQMARGEKPLDWSAAEALAFASLATQGIRLRMSGQDSQRGTFSQRHAVLHDIVDGHTYFPLQNLARNQARVEIYNSPLSETGVLGFEYGYSLDCPDGMVLWEAQFGDFVNAAQVIIDQFIASAEDEWRRLSGIVLLLPHGFEGLGPEHSSARLERFLTLAADENMQVVYASTPAQYFHCLRRQALRAWRKPLIMMTPKSLLRNPRAVSKLEDLAEGSFQRIIPDTQSADPNSIKRVLMCSGKIYYELEEEREKLGRSDIAILRIEQFYPLADELVHSTLAPYSDGTPVLWVQEEPENMGAWRYLRVRFGERMFGRMPFSGITRAASASPATGSMSSHKLEQRQIIDQAFGD